MILIIYYLRICTNLDRYLDRIDQFNFINQYNSTSFFFMCPVKKLVSLVHVHMLKCIRTCKRCYGYISKKG